MFHKLFHKFYLLDPNIWWLWPEVWPVSQYFYQFFYKFFFNKIFISFTWPQYLVIMTRGVTCFSIRGKWRSIYWKRLQPPFQQHLVFLWCFSHVFYLFFTCFFLVFCLFFYLFFCSKLHTGEKSNKWRSIYWKRL